MAEELKLPPLHGGYYTADHVREYVNMIADMFDIPPEIHGEAEDWSRAAAEKIRKAVRSMDRT